jgi:hypothetical protein
MERYKEHIGWKCVLSPEEVEHSNKDFILKDNLKNWQTQSDGSAVLRVFPWTPKRYITMELFIEGLGEYGFSTVNIHKVKGIRVKGVEIVEKEW